MTAASTRYDETLAEVRSRLISVLLEVGGADMTGETPERMLRQAHAWESVGARQLAIYLSEHPDAFVAPSPHIPLSMATLFKLFADNGFGDRVVLPGCVRCGRTDKLLKRPTPEGRCCERCMERVERRQCARCGKIGRIVGQREEGKICRQCYRRDPARHAECAQCGRVAAIMSRTKDGAPLCNRCRPRPKKPCVHCGRVRIVCANTAKGPLCKNCHTAPPRQCGVCGKVRTITRRGDGGSRPDMCQSCSRDTGECVRCGRHRRGSRYRGGAFYCGSCSPRTPRSCSICQSVQPVTAVWPVGPVCQRCYRTRLERPATCAGCQNTRILVCVNESGDAVCTRCGGVDLNFACKDCGEEGPGFRDGRCDRCLVLAKVNTLLGEDSSTRDAGLKPLFNALAAVNPGSVHTWLCKKRSLAWLAELARSGRDITHDEIDRLPQNAQTLHIRAAFVAAGVLPPRNEALAQLQLWVDRTVPTIPTEHQSVIRAYAEWHIVRRARQRAARGPFRPNADSSNRQRIRCAVTFLGWLAEVGASVADLRQHHVDTYFAAGPPNPKALGTFLAWMQARRLITGIEIPRKKDGLPFRFQDQDDQTDQLRRCLTDAEIPLEVRIIGALVRLYAIPVARIVELTTDRFGRDDTHAYLVIEQNSVVLPPSLAALIEELIAHTLPTARPESGPAIPAYLFPGRPPSRPRNTKALSRNLNRYGLPTLTARNSAMIANILDLEPIVVSDLFGVAPQTAHKWAQYAQSSWAAYLAARPSRGSAAHFTATKDLR
jgi:hypothetical protein